MSFYQFLDTQIGRIDKDKTYQISNDFWWRFVFTNDSRP